MDLLYVIAYSAIGVAVIGFAALLAITISDLIKK